MGGETREGERPADQDPALKRARALMRSGAFAEAAGVYAERLAVAPNDLDALYSLAVCQRKLGAHGEAAAALERLLAQAPRHARAHQELGYGFSDLGRMPQAIAAFEKAVSLNPSLYGAWSALAKLPDYPGREVAAREALYLTQLSPPVLGALSFLHEERLAEAEAVIRDFMRQNPRHADGMRVLALTAEKFHALGEAEHLLAAALDLAPDHLRIRFDYANILHRRQKYDASLTEAEKLTAADPQNPPAQIVKANALQALGRFDEALAALDLAAAAGGPRATIEITRGHCLKTIGRAADAVAAYRAAYGARPDNGEAYCSLANLKTYRFTPEEMTRMSAAALRDDLDEDDAVQFGFALGKAHEDAGNVDDAFAQYARANRLRSRRRPYHHDRIEADLRFQRQHFDAAFFAARRGQGAPSPEPIFIVGMPRAGSTLLEQILSAHSEVDATNELANVLSLAQAISNPNLGAPTPYPEVLTALSADDLRALGEDYLAETRRHRAGGRYFIDKMPNNFRHIALIHLMLPNAKIIDARREAMACCFSFFKQFFAEGQEFSYDLADAGHYYRAYVDIMDHWDRTLPGRVLRVQYEDVVADLEAQVRRLLDHCGLPFEEACLSFHESRRAVRTPSSEQVRRPIYDSEVQSWRRFEAHLEPLRRALSGEDGGGGAK